MTMDISLKELNIDLPWHLYVGNILAHEYIPAIR